MTSFQDEDGMVTDANLCNSSEGARLQSELEELKSEYIDAGDRLKEEQNGMMAIRKQTQILSRQVCDSKCLACVGFPEWLTISDLFYDTVTWERWVTFVSYILLKYA